MSETVAQFLMVCIYTQLYRSKYTVIHIHIHTTLIHKTNHICTPPENGSQIQMIFFIL